LKLFIPRLSREVLHSQVEFRHTAHLQSAVRTFNTELQNFLRRWFDYVTENVVIHKVFDEDTLVIKEYHLILPSVNLLLDNT